LSGRWRRAASAKDWLRQVTAEPLRTKRLALFGGALALIGCVVFAVTASVFSLGKPPVEAVAEIAMPMPPRPSPVAEPPPLQIMGGSPEAGFIVPSVTTAAYARTPVRAGDGELAPAPDSRLIERRQDLVLPRIGRDGRMPWQVYARPFDRRDDRARIVLVVAGLGLSPIASEAAIRRLPGAVSLVLDPYGFDLDRIARTARADGHELLLRLPMEPADGGLDDPGPLAMSMALGPDGNRRRLEAALGNFSGYVGVLGAMNSRFTQHGETFRPIAAVLKDRGLMYVHGDPETSGAAIAVADKMGLPRARIDIWIDETLTMAAIDANLARLEQIARANGVAVGLAHPRPLGLERISLWLPMLEDRQFVLAPVSAVVDSQILP
jgi:hypothetical protein